MKTGATTEAKRAADYALTTPHAKEADSIGTSLAEWNTAMPGMRIRHTLTVLLNNLSGNSDKSPNPEPKIQLQLT